VIKAIRNTWKGLTAGQAIMLAAVLLGCAYVLGSNSSASYTLRETPWMLFNSRTGDIHKLTDGRWVPSIHGPSTGLPLSELAFWTAAIIGATLVLLVGVAVALVVIDDYQSTS